MTEQTTDRTQHESPPRRSAWRRAGPVVIPLLAVIAWFGYLWFTMGVLPVNDTFPDGRPKAEGHVKRASFGVYEKHGVWTTYHEADGSKASEGCYELGEKTGTWTYWDEQGVERTEQHDRPPTP